MYNFFIKAIWITAIAGVTSLVAAPLTFTSVGGSQATQVLFDGNVATNVVAGLTSAATFSLSSVQDSGKKWNFQVIVQETGSVNARVAGLGFVDINPTVNGGSVTNAGGTGWQFNFGNNLQFPNQFGSLEACLIDNNNNCNGGGNGGVANGSSATVLFNLTFASSQSSITFNGMGVRYQSIVGVNGGTSGTGSDTNTGPNVPVLENVVPEPATMGLMGLSLAALAVVSRRRN